MRRWIGIFLSLNLVVFNLYALTSRSDVIDNQELLQDELPDSKELNQQIMVNYTFKTIDQFVARLNQIDGLHVQIESYSAASKKPVTVDFEEGMVSELINVVVPKFGYNWSYVNGVVKLNAIYPQTGGGTKSTVLANNNDSIKNVKIWVLSPQDKTLRNVLTKWAKAAHWQLVWNVRADFPITTQWNIRGTFESAVNQLLVASQGTDVPLAATMHDSNLVLEVYSPSISGN